MIRTRPRRKTTSCRPTCGSPSRPPTFHWRNQGLKKYRLQIFNERQEFLYETASPKPSYAFPSKPPFRVIKGAVYYWQVLTPKDEILVRRYSFKLLTVPQVKFLNASQKDFDQVQARMKGEQRSFTEQFLIYNQYRTLDKLVHLLQMWRDAEPENPNVYRWLARAYLMKGCPLKARNCIEKEGQLGLPDPIE